MWDEKEVGPCECALCLFLCPTTTTILLWPFWPPGPLPRSRLVCSTASYQTTRRSDCCQEFLLPSCWALALLRAKELLSFFLRKEETAAKWRPRSEGKALKEEGGFCRSSELWIYPASTGKAVALSRSFSLYGPTRV